MPDDKTYTQMRNEFQEKFFNEISPIIRQFEQERIQNLIISIILTILFSILCVVIFIFSALKMNTGFLQNCIGMVGVCIGSLAFTTIPYTKKCFENSIKSEILPLICSCYGNLTWTNDEYYSDNIFYDANIIVDYPRCNSKYDDMFIGSYKGVDYEILELLWEKTSSLVKIVQHDGILIKLKMNKPFNGETFIESHKKIVRAGLMAVLSYEHLNLENNGKMNLTKLEDVEFNKKYDVYTDDEVEARYLLTTSFMQRLKTMKVAFRADKIKCSFYKDYLLIGLFTKKDLFSICSLFKRIDEPKQFFTMYEEIVSVIKLIDHFKLDQKIGM